MPVIVDSSFYQQPEQPNFLEGLAAGFGEGFTKGIEGAIESKNELERFNRTKAAELEKMREQAKINAEAAREDRRFEGIWKSKEFDLAQRAAKLSEDKFAQEKTEWSAGADARKLQLDALRLEIDTNKALSPVELSQKKLELQAGESALADEAAKRFLAVRQTYAEAFGNGDLKKGNLQLDAAEQQIEDQIRLGNYGEANRILAMVQNRAISLKSEYDNEKAQQTVTSVSKDGNIAKYEDLRNELNNVANDTSMSLAQRASIASSIADKARRRTMGVSIRDTHLGQIDRQIAKLNAQNDDDSTDPELSAQLDARITELNYLRAMTESADIDNPEAVFKIMEDGRQVFYRSGSEAISSVRGMFTGGGSAAATPTSFVPTDLVKSISEQREFLVKSIADSQSSIDQLTADLEAFDEGSQDYIDTQALINLEKQAMREMQAQRTQLFRDLYPMPKPKDGKNPKKPLTGKDIENKVFGAGEDEPPPEYGKGMTDEQIKARIAEIDRAQDVDGISVDESMERDALNAILQGQAKGGAREVEVAQQVKDASAKVRGAFPKEKFNVSKVYSRKEAEYVLGHYKQLLDDNKEPDAQGGGVDREARADRKSKRDAAQAAIDVLELMIDGQIEYPSRPKPKTAPAKEGEKKK